MTVLKGDIYSSTYIKERFEALKYAIIEREQNWDVKITDYILKHYKSQKLFYDAGHPCNEVIREICIGVFKLLQIDCDSIKEINYNLGTYEEPVYPCVIEALGLKWTNDQLRQSGLKIKKNMDFDEYYKEYLYWCYEI